MNHSNKEKEPNHPQPPRYTNLVNCAKAPQKKRSAGSRSPDGNVSKKAQVVKPKTEAGDGEGLKPAAAKQ